MYQSTSKPYLPTHEIQRACLPLQLRPLPQLWLQQLVLLLLAANGLLTGTFQQLQMPTNLVKEVA